MEIQSQNNLKRILASLLIVASLVCVLFGNGVHLHSLMDHIFDHGDIHVVIHSHEHSDNANKDDHHSSGQDGDNHQVAIVDLIGVLSQSRLLATQLDKTNYIIADVPEWEFRVNSSAILELNLPPPDIVLSKFIPHSNSLRAPPLV